MSLLRSLKNITNVIKPNTGNERSVKAKKNIFAAFGLKGISIIIGFIYVPLLLDYLDKERYGIWLTLVSIITWISFFDFGLGNGLRNHLVNAFAKNDYKLAKTLISTSYALLTIIFVSLAVIFIAINPFLDWSRLLNTNIIGAQELGLLALIVFTMFCLRFILKTIGVVLLADQRPAFNSSFDTISQLLGLIIIFILVNTTVNSSLLVLGIILSVNPVFVLSGATILLFKSKYREIRPALNYIDFKYNHMILNLGIKFFFLQITGIVLFASSNFIITQLLGPEQVAPFSVSKQYFSATFMVYAIVMSPIWSAVADAYVRNDYKWLRNTLRKLNYLSVLFFVGIIMMYLVSDYVYAFWFGTRLEVTSDISLSMALFSIINVFGSPYSHFINGFGKLKLGMIVGSVKLIAFIPLAIYLIKITNSPSGAMFATCIINSISLVLEPIQVNKIINKKAYGIWNA